MTITHSTGTTVVYLNQYGANEMVETLLGEFVFDAGTAGSVRMDNNATTGVLIADAMIWRVPIDPTPEISALPHPKSSTSSTRKIEKTDRNPNQNAIDTSATATITHP